MTRSSRSSANSLPSGSTHRAHVKAPLPPADESGTVRKTLHREKLITPRKKKTHSNPSKPRFFERSTPNQMCRAISSLQLGGEAVRLPNG